MAQITVNIVEGWTGALDFSLLSDGAPQSLTGLTVTGQAVNRLREVVDLSSDVTVLSATAGTVRLLPDTTDFLAAQSPYELRFRATDATSIVFFPSEEAVSVIVRR
jgi:hypothetical protein